MLIKLVRLDWRYAKGEWIEEEVDVQTCTVGSTEEPGSCTFDTEVGGEYRITATVNQFIGAIS